MRNQVFAIGMAVHCSPDFARLVLAVTAKHADDNVQHRLISAITHSSSMADKCHTQPARDVIYRVTERLFNDADAGCYTIQDAAHWEIVREATYAGLMAHNCPNGADEIHALLRPFADEPLPRMPDQRRQLSARLQTAYVAMRDISWRR